MKEIRYKNIDRLINPSQIAFIGGADAEVAINEAKRRGFKGSIWPVNPKRDYIAGYKCYKSVLDLPKGPDAVFLAIPATQIIRTVNELNDVNAGGIVCYSAGFKEIGKRGISLEKQLVKSLKNMVLVGPNCYGVINYLENSALWPFAHGGFCPGFGLVVVAAVGSSIPVLIITAGAIFSPVVFRLSRALGMEIMVMDFVEAAKVRGEGYRWIIFKEIWPNAAMPLISDFGLRFIYVILFVSSLSFLGLGVQPPLADWGSMVRENLGALQYGESVIPILAPAIAIASLTVAINLIVDDVSAHAGGKLSGRL